ncbi:hypothetical protein [Nodularia spumigena]|jgi:hypothetical protein|uniref:Uncharacterized protein n=1 Tax=Nodularia spumigena UHCC 0060 TaxID=3110300 RepID=A0ABU5UVJ6_NODSP|nr:hypothetical protein [Nodularia spumigena]MEA5527778.1 hypothetical protein [Nodularia spumigena UHCC 0143]MEA5559058.1 hypothetical protein [Nodularia spumigena CH309]MEA5609873.1 hypothetical protein [Nodularia spumigena UHCC 0060]MEA5609882.1 hypothetical protein [Nodularia spumigena UHCC 0060]MEA5615909.1 hypothetical protein [Nodularia spumigena UHCC 0040]
MIQNQVEGKFFSRPLKGCSLPIGNLVNCAIATLAEGIATGAGGTEKSLNIFLYSFC